MKTQIDKKKKLAAEWIYFFLQMAAVGLVIFLINLTVGGFAIVHGESMEPTLQNKNLLLYIKLGYEPKRGDIVICHSGKGMEEELVKRVIGIPGDVIDINPLTGILYVNGEELKEDYIMDSTIVTGDIHYPAKVPKGQYFLLGDNRTVSMDSRYSEIGTIPKEKIDGHIVARVFPFRKISLMK